jgi:hypothetical protein
MVEMACTEAAWCDICITVKEAEVVVWRQANDLEAEEDDSG